MNPVCATEGCENPRRSRKPRQESGHYCKSCQVREYGRSRPEYRALTASRAATITRKNRAERRDWINRYKTSSGCVDCGYRDHPAALEFDHLPGFHKAFSISEANNLNVSQERLLAEIAKCEVVCANCHAVRTATRREEARDAVRAQ